MFESATDMLRQWFKALAWFFILIGLLFTCYYAVTNSISNSFTGNIFYDGLLSVLAIVFASAVFFAIWKDHVEGDR
jgi:hypothetical protein